MCRNLLISIVLLISGIFAVTANAGYLTWGTEIIAVVGDSEHNAQKVAVNAINGNGLTGMNHSTSDVYDAWLGNDGAASNSPAHPHPVIGWYKITLDQPRMIDKLHIWNFNENTGIGFKSTEIWLSSDGVWDWPAMSSQTIAWVDNLPEASGLGNYQGVEINFTPYVVKEIVIETAGNVWNGGSTYAGLSEVWISEVDVNVPVGNVLFSDT